MHKTGHLSRDCEKGGPLAEMAREPPKGGTPHLEANAASFLAAGPVSVRLRDMKAYFLAASVLVLAGCGDKPAAPAKPAASGNSSGNPITAPVDYLGAVAKGKKTAVKVTDLVSVKQAITMFHNEEERFPKSLKELIDTGYATAIPAPPYQMKYEYNPASGEVKIVPAPAQ
jgi:hypothetical protein